MFFSQETVCYAKIETKALTKEKTEFVGHYAANVRQLAEKGSCKESAATINLKGSEIFTRGLRKKLKTWALKRQIKHRSTVTEPSISFHTPVKFAEAENIWTEKIRTLDLTLEINKVTSKRESQNLSAET